MKTYFLVFFGGLSWLVSLIGWGSVLSRICCNKYSKNWGWFTGLGLSFAVLVGGLLNIFSLISRQFLALFLVIGWISLAIYLYSDRYSVYSLLINVFNQNRTTILLVSVLLLFVLVKYSMAISPGNFNPHDDYQGYFVFPMKMMQTGSMGEDPFSERRIVSSLGGQAFLDCFSLFFGREENLHLADMGVGYLAFLSSLCGLLCYLRVEKRYLYSILFVAVLTPAPIANITSVYTGAALFTCLIWLFSEKENEFVMSSIPLGWTLICSALAALKSTYIPVCATFLVANILQNIAYNYNKKVLFNLFLFALMSIVLLLPWMISSYNSSGTLLYPILGKGFHGSVYGTFLTPTSQVNMRNVLNFVGALQNVLFVGLATVSVYFLLFYRSDFAHIRDSIYLLMAAIVSILLLTVATAAYGIERFSFSFVLPVLLILLSRINSLQIIMPPNTGRDIFSWFIVGMLFGSGMNNFFLTERQSFEFIKFGIQDNSIVSSEDKNKYKAAQEVIPITEIIIARLDKNYLLDFNRNKVFIADYPGGSSLPPGMPFFSGPEALSAYLVEHGINYIAYSYANQAMFSRDNYSDRLDPTVNAWIRSEAMHAFDFQENLEILGLTHEKVYDDGKIFVLKLNNMGN